MGKIRNNKIKWGNAPLGLNERVQLTFSPKTIYMSSYTKP